MANQTIGTREEWQTAREELSKLEAEYAELGKKVTEERRRLPWVPVEKEYQFDTEQGKKTLAELFDGRSQLLVYHFMFGPSVEGWPEAGCPGCSYTADSLDGAAQHLPHHEVTFVAVSRAPLERLNTYKRRMGWSFPWVSYGNGDFNLDFSVFTDEERQAGKGFNFGTPKHADIDVRATELHGLSSFALEDGVVYHAYSTYDRGTDALNATWQLLDRTAKGRDDESHPDWPQRHDEYPDA